MKKIVQYTFPFVLLSMTFISGVFVGNSPWVRGKFFCETREQKRQKMFDSMITGLALRPDQRDVVTGILQEQWQMFQSVRAEVKPRFEAVHTETQRRLAEVLDAPQKERLVRLQERIMNRKSCGREGKDR